MTIKLSITLETHTDESMAVASTHVNEDNPTMYELRILNVILMAMRESEVSARVMSHTMEDDIIDLVALLLLPYHDKAMANSAKCEGCEKKDYCDAFCQLASKVDLFRKFNNTRVESQAIFLLDLLNGLEVDGDSDEILEDLPEHIRKTLDDIGKSMDKKE